jgi:pantothenate kinase
MLEASVFSTVVDAIKSRQTSRRRLIVGIAGPPGAGKSTLAARLTEVFADGVVVPMDGFHLANVELARLGRADRKGAPFTFDLHGYAALLQRIRSHPDEIVYAPAFDHVMNEPIAGSIPVHPTTSIVITEGNYLLHWDPVRELLDLSIYLDAPPDERLAGLIERQRSKGLNADEALDWVLRSDEANARLVQQGAGLADLRLSR